MFFLISREELRPSAGRAGDECSGRAGARGAVLLEVVLALALFVAAAAVIGAGLSAAIEGVERQRFNTHAANLAVSVLSEVQLGLRPVSDSGVTPFQPPFQEWTAQVIQTPTETELGEASGAVLVEVVVRRQDPQVVHRIAQVLPATLRVVSSDDRSPIP